MTRWSSVGICATAICLASAAACDKRAQHTTPTSHSATRRASLAASAASATTTTAAPATTSPAQQAATLPVGLPKTHWTPVALREGRLRADVAGNTIAHITLATRTWPLAPRRPMLFVQLAKALGCEAALADTQLRRLTVAELRAALAHDPSLFPALAPHLSIDNDGTIACLVEFFPISGTTLSAGESTQRLQQLAAGGDAVPAAEKRLVDAWVCLQALDYIAGHGTRRRWFVDRRSGRITGVDNMSVFRAYVDAVVLESLRKRLAATRHFPVPLRQALQKNSVHTLISQLTMDSFFEQPLGPRQRADIADRILTLKSLVHARPAHLQ